MFVYGCEDQLGNVTVHQVFSVDQIPKLQSSLANKGRWSRTCSGRMGSNLKLPNSSTESTLVQLSAPKCRN
jgi:hypothetical protein